MPTAITAMPDSPATDTTVPAGASGTWAQILGWAQDHSQWGTYTLAAVLALLLAASLLARRKRTNAETTGGKAALTRTDLAVTRVTGILATAVVATGAWKVFSLPELHLHWAFRIILFAFAEAQIISAWRRVRRHIHRHAELGEGIFLIYGIAIGSATVAVFDAGSIVEILLRYFAAGVASLMIAEELREELDIYLTANPHLRTGERRKPRGLLGIKWALNPERILVWLRLAEPTERTVEEIERQRRVARYARTAHRLHLLEERQAWQWRRNLAEWRLRRQTESANEHLKLATDPAALAEVRAHLALLYGAKAGTSRTAVADLSPLSAGQDTGHVQAPPSGQESAVRSGRDTVTETGHSPDKPADITPDSGPDTAPPAVPDFPVDARTGHAGDTGPDSLTGHVTTVVRAPRRTVRRTPDRTPKWSKEQLKVFRLRDTRPDMTYPMIAREVGVSDKTVSRWLKAREEADRAGNGPDSERAERVITNPLNLPFGEPAAATTGAVNGHHPTLTEETP